MYTKWFRIWVLIFSLCVSSLVSVASVIWPHENSDLQPDAGVHWGVLPNGLRYVVMPNGDPPGRVSIRLLIQAGSLMESESQRGLAHFLEHMAFNGTRHFAADEMVAYFQRLGMGFGSDTNAHTGFDETVYKLQLPRNDQALLDDSFKLLRDYVDGMLLSPAELEKERGVILSEKRARDSAGYRTYLAKMEFLFPESRVSKRHPIGLERVIAKAPREEFLSFYRKWYTPDRLAVVVAGDVTVERIRPLLEAYFGSLVALDKALPNPEMGRVPGDGLRCRVHREPEASAVSVLIQTVKSYEVRPDSKEKRRDDLFRYAACAMISRRFEVLAKKEDASFSSGGAFAYDWLDFFSSAGVQVDCKPEQWEGAVAVAEQELRRALAYGFTKAEVAEVRANLLNYFEREVETAPTRKSGQLADDIVRAITDRDVYTSPQADFELAKEVLEQLTAEKALEVIRRVWQDGPISVFVSGNLPAGVDDGRLRQRYEDSGKVAVSAPVEADEISFAYESFGEPGKIVCRHHVSDLDVIQLRLGNQVRVNVKQTDFEANTIRIVARFGAGELVAAEDKPGLSQLAESTFVSGGLKKHSAEDIKRIFAGRNVGVGFGIEADAFVLSGRTTPEDFASQLNLMCAYVTSPGYRAEALRQAHKHFDKLYRNLRHTPNGVFSNRVARFLGGGDIRFGYPDQDQLLKRTLEEVKEWLAGPLGSGYMEVSVVGDIDPDVVATEICRTFGTLSARQDAKPKYSKRRQVAFPKEQRQKSFMYDSRIPKGMTAVFWPTTDIWDISRTRRLGVLAEVLSDRLRQYVREEIGETYSPFAFSRQSDAYTDYGYMAALVVGNPDQAQVLAEAVQNTASKLATSGIDEDELKRALAPQLADLKEWVRNNGYWLNTVLAKSQEQPVRLEWARTMQKDFATITVEDINRLAKQYLPASRSLVVTILPEASVK